MDGTFNENDISRVIEADRANVWHHLIQHQPFFHGADPKIIVEGKGIKVWDQKGIEHIDAVSGGVWTVNVGYGRETMGDAVRDAIVKMNFFGGTTGSIPGALFAEKLLTKMPGLDRVYYCNSGSEANEKAFKMVRQIAHKKYGGKKAQDPLPRPRLPRHDHRLPVCGRPGRTQRTIRALHAGFRPRAALP